MLDVVEDEVTDQGESELVPVRIGGQTVLLSVEARQSAGTAEGGEWEIASREPKIEQVLDGWPSSRKQWSTVFEARMRRRLPSSSVA